MPFDLADPVLSQFLRERIRNDPSLTYEALSERSVVIFGGRKSLASTTINKWIDVPTLMSKDAAQKLLQLCDAEHDWAEYRGGAKYGLQKSGVFDYVSRALGSVREMDLEALTSAKIDTEQVASDLVDIDIGLFEDVGGRDWVGSVKDWHEVLVAYPDTWRVFVNRDGRVQGYWMFVHPKRDVFLEACLGNYPEHRITLDTLCSLGSQPVNIYGPGMYVRGGIGSSWDRQVLGARLLLSFLYNLRRLELKSVIFKEICVAVYSRDGQRFVEKFDLQRMPQHISDRYAQEMGWKNRDQNCSLPAIYHGWLDGKVRDSGGLGSSFSL